MSKLFFAPETWAPTDYNPFSLGGCYGESWSAFVYDDSIKNTYTNVYPNAKVYTLSVNPNEDKDFLRLLDFTQYENSYNRNTILRLKSTHRDIILDKLQNRDDSSYYTVRSTDPRWLVHSTTIELWTKIQKDGALLSPSYLKANGNAVSEIGLKALLEPADYSDFIMLDVLNGCGETVVNSRQLNRICLDPNIEYTPGIRIYFDAHKIISDGLATRDGLHVLKVFERLPLDKYMVMSVDASMLMEKHWTPSTFTHFSNEYFNNHMIPAS